MMPSSSCNSASEQGTVTISQFSIKLSNLKMLHLFSEHKFWIVTISFRKQEYLEHSRGSSTIQTK